MAEYRVIYEIDVEADDALSAAREAYASMVDPESMPPVLEVREILGEELHSGTKVLGNPVEFDLSECDESLEREYKAALMGLLNRVM